LLEISRTACFIELTDLTADEPNVPEAVTLAQLPQAAGRASCLQDHIRVWRPPEPSIGRLKSKKHKDKLRLFFDDR